MQWTGGQLLGWLSDPRVDREVAEYDAARPKPKGAAIEESSWSWSGQEDEKLRQAVATFGHKWDLIAETVGNGRGSHACRRRWYVWKTNGRIGANSRLRQSIEFDQ